jgi:autotransporter-associated beta strand protein
MLSRIRSSSLAMVLALFAWTGSVQAAGIVRITEVMSNALTLGNMDWWEITNYGDAAVDITGWKMDDNSFSFGSAVPISPFSTTGAPVWSLINPGESVVFMETSSGSTAVTQFQSLWNLGSGTGNVRNPKLGTYTGSGVSLGSGGDGVIIFDAMGNEVSRVSFGAATQGCSFSWSYDSAGVLGSAPAGTVSNASTPPAYSVTISGTQNTGSPGVAVVTAPVVSLYWSGNGTSLGGSGTWNSSASRWSPTESPVTAGSWADGKGAVFAGTSGTVTVTSAVSPLAMTFATSGYTLASAGSGSIAAGDVGVVAGGSATIAARLTGSTSLTLNGGTSAALNAGAILLAGTANDYTGFTNVVTGTLALATSNVIPDASRLAVSRFAVANFNGFSDTVGGLQGLGTVRMGPTVTVNITGTTDVRLDGFLSGNGDLVIDSTGSGVQRLNTTQQTFNTDFAVKDYVGKTLVNRGGLGVDRTAVPIATTEVTVEAAGRLLLSPSNDPSVPDQIFTFGSNPALPVSLKGGLIGQGAGDDVELANRLDVTGTATVFIRNKAGVSGTSPSTEQFTFSGPLTGPADAVLKILASDTTSGFAQSRAKFTSASGNTFTGTVSPGPYAVARFNGDFTQTSVKLEGGKVDGYGAIKAVTGNGIVSPDGTAGPDGIFTVGSITPVAGTNFNFDLGIANAAPIWATGTQSGNDVLRFTGATPLATALTGANVVNLFVNTTTLAPNDFFDAGFFTTADQTALITNADFVPYILGDGQGAAIEHSGLFYYTLAQWNTATGSNLAATIAMVATTASFDGATNTPGYIMRTTFGAPPAAVVINVPSGSQTQGQAGHPVLSGTTPVEKIGAGTAMLDQANPLSGPTTVSQGTLELARADALSSSAITVAAGATLSVGPQVAATIPSLVNNGLLDVGLGGLNVTSGQTAEGIVAAIIAGRNDGTWSGTSGITSSAAATQSERAVGWLDNGDGSFTVSFAAAGDWNVNGVVDFDDVVQFVSANLYDTGLPATWAEGDYDYNGVVDFDDVVASVSANLFDAGPYNAGTPLGGLALPAGGGLSEPNVLAGGIVAVPEPAGIILGMTAVAALAALWQTRKPALWRDSGTARSPSSA